MRSAPSLRGLTLAIFISLQVFAQVSALQSTHVQVDPIQPAHRATILDPQEFEFIVDDMDLDNDNDEEETPSRAMSVHEVEVEVGHGELKLGLKRMSKCASTFMWSFLPKIAAKLNVPFKLLGERQGLAPSQRDDTFIIATIRNPCSYYASLWGYQHRKPWANDQDRVYDCFDFKNFSNLTKFYHWMDVVKGTQHGIMSVRQWETIVDHHDGLRCWADSMPTCAKQFDDPTVEAAMKTYSPQNAADCWVHLESMEEDLEKCLTEYEKRSGIHMDWAHFDELLRKLKSVNRSPHPPCESFYSGSEGHQYQNLVESQDKYIFEKFGYTTCCGAPTKPMQ